MDISKIIKLESVEELKKGDVFLWKSQMNDYYEIHTFDYDRGYGIQTYTIDKQYNAPVIVNYSGVCGKLTCK